jgi:hypothetical protein
VKALEHTSFPELAERIIALYNEEDDALILGMLGQEYMVRRDGIYLHGQKAPESHAAVVLDYLSSSGTVLALMPWRAIADFPGKALPAFREKVELPLCNYAAEIIARANALLPMIDAEAVPSLIGSEMSLVVRVLPKVYLHVEFFQETQDFPAEAWVLFSNNANEFLSTPSLLTLAEAFKDRLLGLLRIY